MKSHRRSKYFVPTLGTFGLMVFTTGGYGLVGSQPELRPLEPNAVAATTATSVASLVHQRKTSQRSLSMLVSTGTTAHTPNNHAQDVIDRHMTAGASGSNEGTGVVPGEGDGSWPGSTTPHHSTKVAELWEVPRGEVALTIDDGPTKYTDAIVQTLAKYNVKATFFFIGNRVRMFPQAVLDAALEGDVIGDHSESHPVLTRYGINYQAWQILQGARDIAAEDPFPITMFRPPYGSFNQQTEEILAHNHMVLALWNRDPRDWASKTGDEVAARVINDDPSGGVFDLHDTRQTLEALPIIIETLKKQKLQFVVLEPPKQYTGIVRPIDAGDSHAGSFRPR